MNTTRLYLRSLGIATKFYRSMQGRSNIQAPWTRIFADARRLHADFQPFFAS